MGLLDAHGVKLARVVADTAFNTLVLIQCVGFFLFAGNDLLRASFRAQPTTGAGFRVNFVIEKILADTGRAFFMFDMGFVLVPEIENGGQYRIRGRSPQPAKGKFLHHAAKLFKEFDVALAPVSFADSG